MLIYLCCEFIIRINKKISIKYDYIAYVLFEDQKESTDDSKFSSI